MNRPKIGPLFEFHGRLVCFRPCEVCGIWMDRKILPDRRLENPSTYNRRRTCSRACGVRLRENLRGLLGIYKAKPGKPGNPQWIRKRRAFKHWQENRGVQR
jgi:hypothetical protein